MPTYVSLLNFTDQGIRTVKDTLEWMERAAGVAQKHGARLVQNYWTVGPYDAVLVLEAPDDESHDRLPVRDRLLGQRPDQHASGVQSRGDCRDHREAWMTERVGSRGTRGGG